jgi:hypothetical protein
VNRRSPCTHPLQQTIGTFEESAADHKEEKTKSFSDLRIGLGQGRASVLKVARREDIARD